MKPGNAESVGASLTNTVKIVIKAKLKIFLKYSGGASELSKQKRQKNSNDINKSI